MWGGCVPGRLWTDVHIRRMRRLTSVLLFLLLVGFMIIGWQITRADAATDTTAKIYVANEWAKLTNDPTPLSGYTYVGAVTSVYSTFVEISDSTDVAQSTIQSSSDRVTIFVEDADQSVKIAKTKTITSGTALGSTTGASQIVVLSTADSPIVDADGDGLVSDEITITTTPTTGLVTIGGATAGSSTSPGTIPLCPLRRQPHPALCWDGTQVPWTPSP
jgi:hypothetical protein